MIQIHNTHCCALKEIDQLGTVTHREQAIKQIADHFRHYPMYERPTMLLYTGVTKRIMTDHTMVRRADNYGKALSDYIGDNDLGSVVDSKSSVNPQTNNTLKAWVWVPNWTNLFALTETARFRQRVAELG